MPCLWGLLGRQGLLGAPAAADAAREGRTGTPRGGQGALAEGPGTPRPPGRRRERGRERMRERSCPGRSAGPAGRRERSGVAVAVVGRRRGRGLGRGHAQQPPAERQLPLAVAAAEEAAVADAVEAARQHVQQEAAHELLGGERQGAQPAAVAVVAPAEAHAAVLDGQDAVVGEGHAVGVATDVVEHAGGSVEGRLGVDDPLAAAQGPEVAVEGSGVGERGEGAGEPQPAVAEGALELVEEEGAEAAREDAHRQEEAGPAGDPAVAVGGDAAAGDDAVQVGVEGEVGAPGVQHGEEADLGAEVLGVGGDLAQGAGGGAEEQVVEGAPVLQRDGGDLAREREDDVKVGAVEQLGAALVNPGGAGGALALGAVAVAAGAVADAAVAAAVALLDLAAEGGGAAALDGRHDLPLQGGKRVAAALAEGLPVASEDVCDFEWRAGHRAVGGPPAAGCGRGSRSSGLVAEQTLQQATCR